MRLLLTVLSGKRTVGPTPSCCQEDACRLDVPFDCLSSVWASPCLTCTAAARSQTRGHDPGTVWILRCPLPRSLPPVAAAVKKLCSDLRYTCWLGGKQQWEATCPLISAEGNLLKQGCEQHVRFVCRKRS